MGAHAILSPSACERWSHCTAAPRLEARFPSTSSWYADQGTAAHSMAEKKVKTMLRMRCARAPTEYDDDEMDEMTDIYRDVCAEQVAEAAKIEDNPITMVEYRVDLNQVVPEGFGTADFLIVTRDKIWVTDLKYGTGVKVSVVDNPQLKLYGIGAYYNFDYLYSDVKTVCLTIVQPRLHHIESWEISIEELRDWAENYIRPRALIAFKGGPEAEQVPGDWCRFCRAKPLCRACAEEALGLIRQDTAEADGTTQETSQGTIPVYQLKPAALISHSTIEDLMPTLNRISAWINSVFSYALSEAMKGVEFKGYKLVEGRSTSVYSDEKKVIEACLKNGYKDIYKHKLIGIGDMKKLMKPNEGDYERIIEKLVVKRPGKLSLVPDTDKRKEVKLDGETQEGPTAEEVMGLTTDADLSDLADLYRD